MTRREFSFSMAAAAAAKPDLHRLPGRIVPWSSGDSVDTVKLTAESVTNTGRAPVRIKEIVVARFEHSLPPDTPLYGESFQMLSQTAGTLGNPIDLAYAEIKHYRIPQPDDARVLTGMMALGDRVLAFGSCRKFIGRFYLRHGSIEAVLDTEGLALGPGETWKLEEFLLLEGQPRERLFADLAARINRHHPPLKFAAPPAGWCSWYCFGPRATAQQVLANLDVISQRMPALKYVQIDDGYQPAMGDWLETGKAFGGDLQGVLKEIRRRGFEPAIWVAPFIAEAGSQVFQQHPDWFMKGDDGKPLSADKVTFKGWRHGPWYAMDGTHPEVQNHFTELFRTMRQQWGVTYFKLDANFWGAMHGAKLHDPKATRIEAYRRGMQAVLRGSGGAFILGCNHPIWPSFGLIHGSRSSGDTSRKWATLKKIARENLHRNWQNGRLWWNDPDAIVLYGGPTADELQFHVTAAFATGGLILSGDDLTRLTPEQDAVLKKLLPPSQEAARFDDYTLRIGRTGKHVCVFNWEDAPQSITVQLPKVSAVTDFWSGESLGRKARIDLQMPPHSARLFAIG